LFSIAMGLQGYPAAFARHLAQSASLGFAAGWCWALTRTHISFWDAEAGSVITRQLPFQVDQRSAHVAAAYLPSGLCALLVTEQGEAVLWDAVAGGRDPYVSQIDGRVTAVVALATHANGFLAAIGTQQGEVQLLRAYPGVQQGISLHDWSGVGRACLHVGAVAAGCGVPLP
jgi:hypothetical protein